MPPGVSTCQILPVPVLYHIINKNQNLLNTALFRASEPMHSAFNTAGLNKNLESESFLPQDMIYRRKKLAKINREWVLPTRVGTTMFPSSLGLPSLLCEQNGSELRS
jgi:hypothetical protein